MVFICYYLSLSTMQCMHNLPMKAVVFHCRHQTALLQKKERKIWQKYIKYSIYQTVSNRPTENWKRGLQHFLNSDIPEKFSRYTVNPIHTERGHVLPGLPIQIGIFTVLWLESPKFLLTFASSQRKRKNQTLKLFGSFDIEGSPIKTKSKESKSFSFLDKYHSDLT